MAHFSSVVTYGAGRSSQWAKAFVIFSSSGEGKLEAIFIHSEEQCCHGPNFGHRNSLVRIRPKRSRSDQEIRIRPKSSGSDSLTLSRTQKGPFKNLCDQKNGRIFFKNAKKSVYSGPTFFKINIIFRIFWPKILVGGVGNIANQTGLSFSLFVAMVHSDPT
jgi:hypothetical protein